jgi:vacuolar-type H+-ATPase subunit I/STV1
MEFTYTGALQVVVVSKTDAAEVAKGLALAIKHHMVKLHVVSDQDYPVVLAAMQASGAVRVQELWEAPPVVKPVTEAAEAQEETPRLAYATGAQKDEIIRLLNDTLITRTEKTKMLLNINRLDEQRADEAIAKLRKAIEDRGV